MEAYEGRIGAAGIAGSLQMRDAERQLRGEMGQYNQKCDSPVARERQIHVEFDRLASQLSAQSRLVEELVERLQPLLSLDPPANETKANRTEPTCALASAISAQADQVAQNSAIISRCLRRLEV